MDRLSPGPAPSRVPVVQARRILTRRALAATVVSALATAACGDVMAPETQTLSTEELLILAQPPDGPRPTTESFDVVNSRTVVHVMVHPDEFNTRYLEVRVPAGCVDRVAGEELGDQDSVLVTIQPRSAAYGFRLTPDDVTLTDTCGATATLFYGRYGDLSVADGSSTYLDRAAFAAALDLWREITPNKWQVVPGSAATGSDGVVGTLEQPGVFVLAAPR